MTDGDTWTIDHIAHHILTLYALGATSDDMSRSYERNATYQRPPPPIDNQMAAELQDPSFFLEKLGQSTKYYPNYLVLFTEGIEANGYEHVCNEYLFKGDKRANIMLARLYAGPW